MAIKIIRYNRGVSGNLTSAFSRNLATRDERGVSAAANKRRYGQKVVYAPEVVWTDSGVQVGSGSTSGFAAGLDADDSTPLAMISDAGPQFLRLYRGESPTLYKSWTGGGTADFLQGTGVSGRYYKPRSACCYFGYHAIQCSRRITTGDLYEGITIAELVDIDVSVPVRVAMAAGYDDGGASPLDIPAIDTADVISGNLFGQTWSMMNAFPVNRNNTLSAWICGADYAGKNPGPAAGGQVFLYQINRASVGAPWVSSPMIYWDDWVDGFNGRHIHGAAVVKLSDTSIAIYYVLGDNSTINEVKVRELSWTAAQGYWEGTLAATKTVHGGFDSLGGTSKDSPQPVALAPGPDSQSFLGSGDVTRTPVIKISRVDTDTVAVSSPIIPVLARTDTGWDPLHLHYLQGVGYALGGSTSTTGIGCNYISPNGVDWAQINVPVANAKKIWRYGKNKLLWVHNSTGNIYTATVPLAVPVYPLQISPGGTNRTAATLSQASAPEAGNTVAVVTYNGSQFLDGATPITPQPPPPPGVNAAAMLRFSGSATNDYYGSRWLTESAGPHLDWSVPNQLNLWACNLNPAFGGQLRFAFGTNTSGYTYRNHFFTPYLQWVPLSRYVTGTADATRTQLKSFSPNSNTQVCAGTDVLILVDYAGPLNTPPYSMAPGATGADELEEITGFTCGASWTIGLIYQWPVALPTLIGTPTYTVATLWQDATNYVTLTVAHTTTTASTITADFVVAGSSVGTVALTCDIQAGHLLNIVLSNTGTAQVLAARNHRIATQTNTGILVADVRPTAVRFSNDDQTAVHSVNPIVAEVVDDAAWDVSDATVWMRSMTHLTIGHEPGSKVGRKVAAGPVGAALRYK